MLSKENNDTPLEELRLPLPVSVPKLPEEKNDDAGVKRGVVVINIVGDEENE